MHIEPHSITLKPSAGPTAPYGCPSHQRCPDFLLRATSDDTCAALRKKCRMQIIKATALNRNPRGSPSGEFVDTGEFVDRIPVAARIQDNQILISA
jgi:hypothetical protein